MQVLRIINAALVFALVATILHAGDMRRDEQPDEVGMALIGKGYFVAPKGTKSVKIAGGDFEDGKGDWKTHPLFTIKEGGAPSGKKYLAVGGAKPGVYFNSPQFKLEPAKPYLLSAWIRSQGEARAWITTDAPQNDRSINAMGNVWLKLPDTKGEWRRVGIYFLAPASATGGRWKMRFRNQEKVFAFALDDVRLRTATFAEWLKAYDVWRKKFPAYDITPRETDGSNLALTAKKLSGGGIPGKPFLIWAIGSSYTNKLGFGRTLIAEIRRRFPQAPPIIYKKHVGSSVPWKYVRGWAQQFVAAQQPDLVLIYTIGRVGNLDQLLAQLRRRTTADIIVPTIHVRERDRELWKNGSEDAKDQKVGKVREVCKKYGVELVESRGEWIAYLQKHKLDIVDLLAVRPDGKRDGVHQNDRGALLINENIVRHIAKHAQPSYRPEERERRLPGLLGLKGGSSITASKGWTRVGSAIVARTKGASLKVEFTGNRIDLIGLTAKQGGSIKVLIDGKPADQAAAFYGTFIKAGPHFKQGRLKANDSAPHSVFLEKNLVPQDWKINLLDDQGNYELVGSVTGADGRGNVLKMFTSKSGQIRIDPELWRRSQTGRGVKKRFANTKGDDYSFAVRRAAAASVSFKGRDGLLLHRPLVQHLANGKHVLEIVCNGDGTVAIDSFYIFTPPLK